EWVLQALADAQADMRLSTHPRLTLEVALARAANLEVRETQTVVARLERLERLLLSGERPAAPAPPRPAPAPAPAKKAPAPAAPKAETKTEKKAEAPEPGKEPEVPKAAPAPAPAPVEGSLDEQWAAVLELVRSRSRVTHTHLREGWPVDAGADKLVVGFAKEFHAVELGKRPDHMERVNAAIEQVFGRKLRLDPQVRSA